MLEIGYNTHFEIRKARLACPVKEPLRVLYLSDLHFNGRSEQMAIRISEEVRELSPDLILLGGDYVDTRAGLAYLDALLAALSGLCQVLAVAGNHDRFFGIKAIEHCMQKHKVQWIEGRSLRLSLKNSLVVVDGNCSLLENEKADVRMLCLHQPLDPAKLPACYQLAFAGHLHGSQFVLWENEKGLFPGRFFYKWNILEATIGHCRYYISKGLGDTLPLRYNCPKDLLVVDLVPHI